MTVVMRQLSRVSASVSSLPPTPHYAEARTILWPRHWETNIIIRNREKMSILADLTDFLHFYMEPMCWLCLCNVKIEFWTDPLRMSRVPRVPENGPRGIWQEVDSSLLSQAQPQWAALWGLGGARQWERMPGRKETGTRLRGRNDIDSKLTCQTNKNIYILDK